MEEIILEIIQRNYNEFTGTNEAGICSASEIASLWRAFFKWAIVNITEDSREQVYTYSHGCDEIIFYTLDELFSYWYTNVRKEEK